MTLQEKWEFDSKLITVKPAEDIKSKDTENNKK